MHLQHALKEWSVAVDALLAGETSLLLRKGGIREESGRFTVPYEQVLLYPTFEHQRPDLLKSAYSNLVQPVPSGWHPETVEIKGWAGIERVVQVSEPGVVKSLLPHHVWNEQFITERLKWKPRQPIYGLILRAFALPTPVKITWREDYGGCRSWIDLADPFDITAATPALTDAAHQKRAAAIAQTLEPALAE